MSRTSLSLRDVEPRLTKLGYYIHRSTGWQDAKGNFHRWVVGRLQPRGEPQWGFRSLIDVLSWVADREIDEEYRRASW